MRGDMLKKELGIFTFGDLLFHYPFRYVDKTKFHKIRDLVDEGQNVQLKGILRRLEMVGEGRKKRLTARFRDETGVMDLVWFKGVNWVEKKLEIGLEYIVYGRISFFKNTPNISHPEMEAVLTATTAQSASTLEPVYPSTEKLKVKNLDSKGIRKLQKALMTFIKEEDITENIPSYIKDKMRFPSRYEALINIHFPKNHTDLKAARNRLKFEELFYLQLRLLQIRKKRNVYEKGFVFTKIDNQFMRFYNEKIPFELTGAQKRVIREIREDVRSGAQMNRLLQGDVGSGKTMVGLMTMLMALNNGYQACMMAPTEILAQQHYISITKDLEGLGIQVGFLSGSVKGKKRKALLEALKNGDIHILLGTHALIEDPVVFHNLGLAIIDEQHRFGVMQRAKLWAKSKPHKPHILVMSATPIPRTLAMTLYGDLDVSVIDEMPPGRQPIKTVWRNESHRMRVFGFMREQIAAGRQVYVVFPLIEESETLDLHNLMEGHESISREFPQPKYQISVVHGKMKAKDKDYEMQRFAKHETHIMVATTVIEVGVNVPNATLMIIENTERFGLSQLHQLRGRVGRGGGESFCILMSSYKLTQEGRSRIQTMVSTTDGFKIAEADMKLRGAGNIEGTQQSGIINFRIADLSKDTAILKTAREIAARVLDDDMNFERDIHLPIKRHMASYGKKVKGWSKIS